MTEPRPNVFSPNIGQEEIDGVIEVLKARALTYFSGKKVNEFEQEFARYCGSRYAVATSSGTSALHIALSSLDVGPGDEVIVPAYTFIGTALPVLYQNAIPVFVDIDPEFFTVDPLDLQRKITEKTRAIIVVHLFGCPAEMDEIMRIANSNSIPVIEDACQAHGAEYRGKKVGTIGKFGCFSFYENKNMTTGEGGMLITDDLGSQTKARLLRNNGELNYDYVHLGYNYRMTEIQAAIGIAQLKKLDFFNHIRNDNAHYLMEKLRETVGIEFSNERNYVRHVYHALACKIIPSVIGMTRENFLGKINRPYPITQIEFQFYGRVLYSWDFFKKLMGYGKTQCPYTCTLYGKNVKYTKGLCPTAESVCPNIIGLPTAPSCTTEVLDALIDRIRKVARK